MNISDFGLLIIKNTKRNDIIGLNPVLIIGSIYNPLMATVAKIGQQQLIG